MVEDWLMMIVVVVMLVKGGKSAGCGRSQSWGLKGTKASGGERSRWRGRWLGALFHKRRVRRLEPGWWRYLIGEQNWRSVSILEPVGAVYRYGEKCFTFFGCETNN